MHGLPGPTRRAPGSPITRAGQQVPPVAERIAEDHDLPVGLGPRFAQHLQADGPDPGQRVGKVVDPQEQPDPAGELPPMADTCSAPSALASSRPVPPPGGRTTTHRLGRPSLVSDGESSATSKPSTPVKNSIAAS